jgi:sulfhydrogenase subunit delta
MTKQKLKIGVYGITGCAGCLLTFLFEPVFKELVELVDIKAFPLIKEDSYKGNFDYIFVEGTVCFDKDILKLTDLRSRTKYIVALGTCSCVGGVPSIKNFLNHEETAKIVYSKTSHLRSVDPTPIDMHIKVDYYLPECPPNKEELLEFIKFIGTGRKPKQYKEPVCFECRRKANPCQLDKGKICLGPVTNGGCNALCPSNSTVCYGCRGPCKDSNYKAFLDTIKQGGYTKENMQDIMRTFSGLQFNEDTEIKDIK